MPIDAIGATLGANDNDITQRAGLDPNEFIKLFLAQLTFQDPLEPVDNREFLAQMAQFAGLEQARTTNDSIQNLVFMNASAQSFGLLGRQVEVQGATGAVPGTVSAINFSADGPQLTINLTAGGVLAGVKLSQVTLVRF